MVIMTKGNEFGGRTDFEVFFVTTFLIIDLIIIGIIIGEVSVLVLSAKKRSSAFEHKIDLANSSMRYMDVPTRI